MLVMLSVVDLFLYNPTYSRYHTSLKHQHMCTHINETYVQLLTEKVKYNLTSAYSSL